MTNFSAEMLAAAPPAVIAVAAFRSAELDAANHDYMTSLFSAGDISVIIPSSNVALLFPNPSARKCDLDTHFYLRVFATHDH
jgi:hypothetical protein